MMKSKIELRPLHCVYFIYYSFSTTTDKNIQESEVNHIITYLTEWTKDANTSRAIIKETLSWVKETNPSKEDTINIMCSMVDFINDQNVFSTLQKEFLLLHIRQIARSDGDFSEEEKKYHDLLAYRFGISLRVSSCSSVEIKEDAKKVERKKIGFRISRA